MKVRQLIQLLQGLEQDLDIKMLVDDYEYGEYTVDIATVLRVYKPVEPYGVEPDNFYQIVDPTKFF